MSQGGTWHLGADQDFIFVTDALQDIGYQVSAKKLASYHPDLAFSVRTMLGLSPHLFPYEVKDALQLLQSGTMDCIDTRGMHVRFLYMLSLHEVQESPERVAASGKRVTIEYKYDKDRKVPVIVRSTEAVIPVLKSEFERVSPGWEKRWKIAVELDVDEYRMMDYVFTNITPAEPGMTGITFG